MLYSDCHRSIEYLNRLLLRMPDVHSFRNAKYYLYVAFFVVLMVVALHYLFDAGLSCIDYRGCLRDYCTFDMLNSDYQAVYLQYIKTTNCVTLGN